jgi:hypothetical protein
MTDFRESDPRLRNTDARLRDPDPLEPATGYSAARRGNGAVWGWILGAVVLAVVLAFVFSMGGDGTQTASPDRSPPTTTGAAPSPTGPTRSTAPTTTPSPTAPSTSPAPSQTPPGTTR